MCGAREVDRYNTSDYSQSVKKLAHNAGLPMPKVYIVDDPQPVAFATVRNPENADDVAGVMAHELAHVRNHYTLIMTITATIAGALSMLAQFALFFGNNRNNPLGLISTILVVILAPVAAMLI